VYLAAARPPEFHRRDTLLALFWPDHDEAGARAALSRALHHLRQALGAGIIASRGDQELTVDRALLTSDLFDLEEALRRGDAAAALALYQGDLLPGFHVDDAAEFDGWLEGVRQRVRSAVGIGATEGSQAAERAGDLATAVSLARRASELLPYSESALLYLMRLLEARGDRSDALVAYQTFVTRFRADLAASPSPDLRTAAERIRQGPLAPGNPPAASPPPDSLPPRIPRRRTIAPRTGGSAEPALHLVAEHEVGPQASEPAPAESQTADPTPLPPPALFRNRRRAVSLWRGRAPWVLATMTLGVLGILGVLARRSRASNISLSDFRQITRAPEPELEPVISPNGADVAYTAGYHPGTRLFVTDLAGGRAVALSADSAGTQGGLRWMPDGRSLTFTESGATYIVPRFGGPARLLLDRGEVWSVHGDWLAYSRADSLFIRQGTAGAEVLAAAPLGGPPHSAAWAPDGRRLLFVVGNQRFVRGPDIGNVVRSAIWLVRRDGGTHRVVDDGKMNLSPVWLPDGRGLLFTSNQDGPRDIYLLRLNRADSAAGGSVRLTTGLEPHTISLSADGRTVAYSRFTIRKNIWRIALPDRGSVSIREAERIVTGKENAETHDVSADGLWLTFDSDRGGNHDIYIMPLKGGEARRVTADPNNAYCPAFSPDGREIVFMSQRHGAGDLFSIRTDGTGEQRLTDTPGLDWYPSFAPDGRHISYIGLGAAPGVYVLSREAGTEQWGRPRQLLATEGDNPFPGRVAVANWSPNGREIVFATKRRIEVVDLEAHRRVVLDARLTGLSEAFGPEWSADGRTIYFQGVDGAGLLGIYAVAVAGGVPRPVVLLDKPGLRLFEALTVRGNHLVVTLAEYEADVWTARLKY